VHAGSVARLEQSYQDIADQVGIAGRTDAQVNVFELVRNWLRSEKNGKWLLVLDNADDDAIFASLPCTRDQQHLSRYLPLSKHGMVIVTSRSAHATSRLVEDRDTFHLGPMHDSSAQALLVKKLGGKVDVDGLYELAAALEYMPLALVQAAAYIQKRAPHCSVQRYLEEFRRNDKRKTRLLSQEAGHLRRNEGAKNSIIVTWQISFEHIRSIRKSAANTLSLMSFFDRQGIPKALLRSQSAIHIADDCTWANREEEGEIDKESASESDTDDSFIEDILLLRDYSFISETTDPETLEMHSLVQLATQKWLEGKGEVEGWKQHFIRNMCGAFPTGQYENWGICEGLFPHAVVALRKQPRDKESCKEWATLLYNAAWYAWERGDVQNAMTLAMSAMESRKAIFGAESDDTLSSMAMVGLVKKLGGQWEEAEKLFVQVMVTRKTKLGADHPDTLTSIANLASTYRNQGRWEEAEKLEVQVMETHKTKLGADHPDMLTSMANLALTYWNQGRWEEAEKLEVQVMETSKTKLGAGHPDTLTSMGNLASTFWNQGRWEEAEKLEVQVMETRKTKLGADHPDTLTSMANLAVIYRSQGRWEEAEKLEVQVMETRKTKLGADHPDTLTSMDNLAFTWKSLGRDAQAIALLRQCAQQRQTVLRAGHPDLLSSIRALEEWNAEQADADLCIQFEGMLLAEGSD
jgi:tetratricopeptide (TPR) repeat protein